MGFHTLPPGVSHLMPNAWSLGHLVTSSLDTKHNSLHGNALSTVVGWSRQIDNQPRLSWPVFLRKYSILSVDEGFLPFNSACPM